MLMNQGSNPAPFPRYILGILLKYHCISDFKMESYKVTGKMCMIVKDTFPFELICFE